MARARRRRKFNLRKVRVNTRINIGALAADDVIVSAITAASTNPYRLMSCDISYSLVDLGATADDGQEIGLAHSDYSAAEVEECIESTAGIDIGDKIAIERADRLVRTLGQLHDSTGTGAGLDFNNGLPMKTKLNWAIGIGDQLNIYVRNGSSVVYTTGAGLNVIGHVWIKDGL